MTTPIAMKGARSALVANPEGSTRKGALIGAALTAGAASIMVFILNVLPHDMFGVGVFFAACVSLIGFTQLVWTIPTWLFFRVIRQPKTARGLAIFGIILALANVLFWVLIFLGLSLVRRAQAPVG
jgi:hypothetical protein